MVAAKARRSFGLPLPLTLLALLLVLAWLQYRWTVALSRAEAERLRSGLSSSLARFNGELDFELARVLRAFSMRSPSELPEALAEFRHQSHYPDIVAELYRLGFEDGKLELGRRGRRNLRPRQPPFGARAAPPSARRRSGTRIEDARGNQGPPSLSSQ